MHSVTLLGVLTPLATRYYMLGSSKAGTTDFRHRMNDPADSVVVDGPSARFWKYDLGASASGKLLTMYYQLENPNVLKKRTHGHSVPAKGPQDLVWGEQARDLGFYAGTSTWPRPGKARRRDARALAAQPALPSRIWIAELLAAIHVRNPKDGTEPLVGESHASAQRW